MRKNREAEIEATASEPPTTTSPQITFTSALSQHEDLLTREQAISLLKEGIPPQEIAEAYPKAFTLGQLGAFKTHVTMGTYG
jgi:hypothetical protein